jgi:hypothetical protein
MPSSVTIPTIGSTSLATLAGEVANSTFIGQIAVALSSVALMVIEEDPTYYNVTPSDGSGAGQHYARSKLATLVLSNPVAYATQSFCSAVVGDFVTTSGSSDDALIARVAALWNDMSTPFL